LLNSYLNIFEDICQALPHAGIS